MVTFDVVGENFLPESISQILEIIPTEIHIKGELNKYNMIRNSTRWIISTGYEVSDDINNQLEKVLSKLYGKESRLNKLKNELKDIEFMVIIVIKIINNDKPSIYIDENIIKYLGELGASIHFDYYFFDDEVALGRYDPSNE